MQKAFLQFLQKICNFDARPIRLFTCTDMYPLLQIIYLSKMFCKTFNGNNTIRFIFTAERRTLPRGPVGDNALFGGRGWEKKAPNSTDCSALKERGQSTSFVDPRRATQKKRRKSRLQTEPVRESKNWSEVVAQWSAAVALLSDWSKEETVFNIPSAIPFFLALSYLHCPWQIKAAVVLQPYWSSRGLSTSSSIAGTSAIHLLQPLFSERLHTYNPINSSRGNFGFHVLYKLEMRHRWPKKITSD
ncbi:hypothetical protein CEXT_164641 [Caerostris extrusa]|uniref:Uncharacterized protein n=1 Tax=Caerostris extrusa TaxID=172846 RepID=A0AAV4SL80_CAEEX|nr:hypothetical protein CEXT_164641 [Caerostris extrusa]